MNIAIIGSGISGITAARTLQQQGCEVIIFDKGKAPGGRFASKRVDIPGLGQAIFDYGAQFFTSENQKFRDMITRWEKDNLVRQWFLTQESKTAWRGIYSMRNILVEMAKGLNLYQNKKIARLNFNDRWELITSEGENYFADKLLITIPAPQTLELLHNSGLEPDEETMKMLKEIMYFPVLTLMVTVDGKSRLHDEGKVSLRNKKIAWIADNRRKGLPSETTALTVHCSPEYSELHYDKEDRNIISDLKEEILPFMEGNIQNIQLHRWKYGFNKSDSSRGFLFTAAPGPLWFAGDSFTKSKVEETALSGMAAAEDIIKSLS